MSPNPAASASAAAFPKKSVDRTVFVRFRPTCSSIRRHHLEDLFSQVGPIKKTSVVVKKENDNDADKDGKTSCFGFVKYTTDEDAKAAVAKLNHKTIRVEGQSIQVIVEAASVDNSHQHQHHNNRKPSRDSYNSEKALPSSSTSSSLSSPSFSSSKNQTRLILRNLAFRTTESNLRKVLEQQFGPLIEVHLPTVPNTTTDTVGSTAVDKNNDKKKKNKGQNSSVVLPPPQQQQHRGFGFVQFAQAAHAAACVASSPLLLQKRQVQVAYTRNKDAYEKERKDAKEKEKQQQREDRANKKRNKGKDDKIEPESDPMEEENDDEVDREGEKDEKSEDDEEMEHEDEHVGNDNDDDDNDDDDDDDDDDNDDDDDEDNDDDDKMEEDAKDHDHEDDQAENTSSPDTSIQERRVVFLRNLPFDTTRQDVFELIRKFGRIEAIYLVKNKNGGGLFAGSCFVRFAKREAAETLVQTYNRDVKFTTQRQAILTVITDNGSKNAVSPAAGGGIIGSSSGPLLFRGREIFVDWAVDKETAEAISNDKKSDLGGGGGGGGGGGAVSGTKDRRHLYLKEEGRVDDPAEWQSLPPSDQLKRQRAWTDKLTKLKSPLFFINPTRLSIRNLSKSVDEKALKQLCVLATKRGMDPSSKHGGRRVSVKDVILHYKAKGELSHRDILAKLQQQQSSSTKSSNRNINNNNDTPTADEEILFPAIDENNVKRFIPSVFIDRDFTGANKKQGEVAPSRGFGFVEFTHHVHALACLRELNNNPAYASYVAGGTAAPKVLSKKRLKGKKQKKSENGAALTLSSSSPRLIVEFAVENVAKAKQQALHRAQQEMNQKQQRQSHQHNSVDEKNKKQRKSRGALQRERKRKQREETQNNSTPSNSKNSGSTEPIKEDKTETIAMHPGQPTSETTSIGPRRPLGKRRKVDPAEVKFTKLLDSYKETGNSGKPYPASEPTKNVSKRWFDE